MEEERGEPVEVAPTSVLFVAPQIAPVRVVLASLEPVLISSVMREHPDLCFFTNYDLLTKSGPLRQDSSKLASDIENGDLVVTVKVMSYSESDALQHAQNLARIVFSLSSRFQYSDVNQSIAGWLKRNFSDKLATLKDLTLPYPLHYMEAKWGRVIKYMDVSKEEVTTKERLLGVLLKLDVTTVEGENFCVKAAADGWFVDGGKHYPTLNHLLKSISKEYSDNCYLIAKKWCQLEKLEQMKYEPVNQTNCFQPVKLNSKGKFVSYQTLKLMQDPVSVPLTSQIDDSIDAAKTEEYKDLLIASIEQGFVKQVVDGIALIKRGVAPAAVGDDGNYMWQDLFISPIEHLAEFYAEKGGRASAEKSIRNEVRLYQQMAHMNEEVRVTRTMMIDYFNERWVVQTLIPGLLNHRAKIVHGPEPENKKVFSIDPEFKALFEKVADDFGLAPSPVTLCDEPILSSSEVNGVVGTDGIKYFLDMHRTTPRDANYPDPVKHHACIVRPEAVRAFELAEALEAHSKELIALGGQKEFSYRRGPDSEPLPEGGEEKLMERRQEIISAMPRIKFDINALTVDSKLKETPKNILDLAKFITDSLLPKFVRDTVLGNGFVFDGRRVCDEMHGMGINIRYLGKVADLVKKEPESPLIHAATLILESEMISRAFKVLVRLNTKMSIPEFLHQLNVLIGLEKNEELRQKLFKDICEKCQEKFGYTPTLPIAGQKVLILRSVLIPFGISVVAHGFDKPLTVDDIVTIKPVVAFPFSENLELREHIDLATTLYSNGAIDYAYKLLVMAIQDSDHVVSPFDKGLSMCYFYLGLIYQSKGLREQALNAVLRSLMAMERHNDQLHPEIIVRYAALSEMARAIGSHHEAFAYAARAAHLAFMLAPFHPWVVQSFLLAAEIALRIDLPTSLSYFEMALSRAQQLSLPDEVIAKIYQEIALAKATTGDVQEVLRYEDLAFKTFPAEQYKLALERLKSELAKQ